MKKGARIGAFPRGTIMRSSLTVDPTRSSQPIVPRHLWKFPCLSKICPNHLLPPMKCQGRSAKGAASRHWAVLLE
ncbi:hypothetical protein F2Q69_00012442 [Brassica cretica]|uniref:Uncharacterized protein n=2 Tax=Brassica cretica TaxID=69181 RepID=A0A8S9QRS0_BRACR|nr:hypothetical protein F2Q69_00012442 [Brassica cretica]KAF3581244.1 hypothetical protein DY000_02030570 [Brassica cretica]